MKSWNGIVSHSASVPDSLMFSSWWEEKCERKYLRVDGTCTSKISIKYIKGILEGKRKNPWKEIAVGWQNNSEWMNKIIYFKAHIWDYLGTYTIEFIVWVDNGFPCIHPSRNRPDNKDNPLLLKSDLARFSLEDILKWENKSEMSPVEIRMVPCCKIKQARWDEMCSFRFLNRIWLRSKYDCSLHQGCALKPLC